jgi:hypothetical protein
MIGGRRRSLPSHRRSRGGIGVPADLLGFSLMPHRCNSLRNLSTTAIVPYRIVEAVTFADRSFAFFLSILRF